MLTVLWFLSMYIWVVNCKCGKRRHIGLRLLLEHHFDEFIVVQLSVSVHVRLLHKLLNLLLSQLLTQHSGYLNLAWLIVNAIDLMFKIIDITAGEGPWPYHSNLDPAFEKLWEGCKKKGPL